MNHTTPQQLSAFLSKADVNAPFKDKIKIAYRPYICPFDDLLEIVKDGNMVYDVGCGSGQFLLLVSQFTNCSEVSGIEISEQLIKNARQLFVQNKISKPFSFNTFDGDKLPEDMAKSDVVFLIDVLHHVPPAQQHKFLKNIFLSMKKGATFVLKDIDASGLWVYFNKLHDLLLSSEIGNELKLSEATDAVKSLGFEIVEVKSKRMWWYAHYTLVLKKP